VSAMPNCPSCAGPLRWDGVQWLCDRCRIAYPPQPQPSPPPQAYAPPQAYPPAQAHQQPYYPQPAPAAAPRSSVKLWLILGGLVLVGGAVALILVLTLGGGGGRHGAASPEAVVKSAIDAVRSGDGDAYARLFSPPELGERMVDCQPTDDEGKKQLADARAEQKKAYPKVLATLKRAVEKSKGKKLEFVTLEPEDPPDEVPAGKELNQFCKVKVAHATQRFEVAYKLDGDKQEAKVSLLRVEGTWYLGELFLIDTDAMEAAQSEIDKEWEHKDGDRDAGATSPEDEMDRDFRTYVDQVCACKDMKCVTDTGARFAEKYKDKQNVGKPTAQMTMLVDKMSECTKRLMEEEMKRAEPGPPDGGDGTGIVGQLNKGGFDTGGLAGGDDCDRFAAHLMDLYQQSAPMTDAQRTAWSDAAKARCQQITPDQRACAMRAQTPPDLAACNF
jgi:hypothetical protein